MLCAIDFSNLHSILRSLYDEMMPLCGDMAGVAQGIAGLGALFYVAYRIWQSLARAEPIDVFPLLPSLRHRFLYNVLSLGGAWHHQLGNVAHRSRYRLDARRADPRHEEVPEEKDRLEYEQMMNDPSTAYLVDDAEFDRQIDELGCDRDWHSRRNVYRERYV